MIDVLLKGMGVGLAVAAPVGPIGLLCIKRTLTHGGAMGLSSGLGAASADAIYGILVASGFAATGLLVAYAMPMALMGGLLIAVLGLLSLRRFFQGADAQAAHATGKAGLVGAFASTFTLTLSNPMTILAFVALIAGLGASAASSAAAPYVLVVGVFLGSALWWCILVAVSLAARSRMGTGTTRWLDAVSGLVLLVWGLWIAWTALTGGGTAG